MLKCRSGFFLSIHHTSFVVTVFSAFKKVFGNFIMFTNAFKYDNCYLITASYMALLEILQLLAKPNNKIFKDW